MDSIERAARIKEKLAAKYGVSPTAIVWTGKSQFIICKDGQEIMARPYEDEAAKVAEALRKFAERPETIDAFESYLSFYFENWLHVYARDPEGMAEELMRFASLN